ncbi:MAG: elongation factor P [Chloroflexi bacterium]|nr:elongation factor P [Chloroflexota bacterium]MBI3733770.1 elongation factor P [Chloroflexota bacterium]
MIGVEELRKGITFTQDGQLWRVLEYSHNKQGRGNATIRVKLRNLRTGGTLEKSYQSGGRVEDIRLDHREMTYLYHDGDFYHFMDVETYEQSALDQRILGDAVHFLKEGLQIKVSLYDNDPVDVELPTAVELKVAESAPGVKGDTASGATKPATLESGYTVQVPLFVQPNDTVRVDTRTGAYVTRV